VWFSVRNLDVTQLLTLVRQPGAESGRLLRDRAIALLRVQDNHVKPIKKLLNDFYGYRSTIAHGDPLPIDNADEFHRQMWVFETLVRSVLKAALQMIPAEAELRRQALTELSGVTEEDQIEFLRQRAKGVEDAARRERIVAALEA